MLTPCPIGLQSGKNYTLSVWAQNSIGFSASSGTGQSTFTTVAITVPSKPRDKTVSSISYTSANVSWLPPVTDGNSALLGYKISFLYVLCACSFLDCWWLVLTGTVGYSWASGASSLNFTTSAGTTYVSATGAASTFLQCMGVQQLGSYSTVVAGLAAGTTYTIEVWAFNSIGYSEAANGTQSFATLAFAVASEVRNKTVTSITATTAYISWLAPLSDGGSTILAYQIAFECALPDCPNLHSLTALLSSLVCCSTSGSETAYFVSYTTSFSAYGTPSCSHSSDHNPADASW
jgi:hypothetical protein